MTSKETIKCIEKQQKFVRLNIEEAFEEPWKIPDGITSDSISVAFERAGIFNKLLFTSDNWNDRRISLFRHFFSDWFGDGIHNEIVFIGELEIVHQWDEDQNYVFIRNINTNNLYYITWYKSRGRTDSFLKNGNHITLTEFRYLLEEMLKPIRTLPQFLTPNNKEVNSMSFFGTNILSRILEAENKKEKRKKKKWINKSIRKSGR